MTCFWDSIYSQLDLEDYKYIGFEKPSRIEDLIRILKTKNKNVDNVTWQKTYLSHNEKDEHFTAVKVYNITNIKNGHLTSVCDSFLLLICEIFEVSITHRFMNTTLHYDNLKNSRKTLKFTSNSGHFQNAPNVKNNNNRTTQNRLNRIRNNAINVNTNIKIKNNNSTNQKIEKAPSWRARPQEYLAWREKMRNMKI